mgnify:FL=1
MGPIWCVILSWNGREETLGCLETVAALRRRPDRVVVIDNGSQDELGPALKRRFPWVMYRHLPENVGFAAGMRLGMAAAVQQGAEYIWTLNNDTRLDPDCLDRLLEALAAEPRAAAVAPKILLADPPGRIYFRGGVFSRITLKPLHPGENRADPEPGDAEVRRMDFLNGCAPFFRVRALAETGGYTGGFWAYFEDADLSLRLRARGWLLLYQPRARVIHRHGAALQANAGPGLRGTVSPFKWYLVTRNRLWLLRMHGTIIQKMLGGAWFLAWSLFAGVLLAARGRP